LINYTGEDKAITEIALEWPADPNGDLVKIRLDGGLVWDGDMAGNATAPTDGFAVFSTPTAELSEYGTMYTAGWNDDPDVLTLNQLNNETIRLEFDSKTAKTGYTVRLSFDDGTFMEFTL